MTSTTTRTENGNPTRTRTRLVLLTVALFTLPCVAQHAPAPTLPAGPLLATTSAPPTGFTDAIVLFPAGAPLALRTGAAAMEGDVPKLFTYPASGAGPHPAVIVLPGGGYTHVVMGKEGDVEAKWLSAHGVTAFVLEYRLAPAYHYPAPMLDCSQAIRYVRANAARLGVDPSRLGLWGFSAGGHLAGLFATVHKPGDTAASDPLLRGSDRPDFVVLSYARLALDPAIPNSIGAGNRIPMQGLLPADATQETVDAIDPVKHVTAESSPSFLYSTGGDKTVDSLNAAVFYVALKKAGVTAELHIFERGPHGTGMADMQAQHLDESLRELALWPTLLANWMQANNWMPAQTP